MDAEQSSAVNSLLQTQLPFTHFPLNEQSLGQRSLAISSTKFEPVGPFSSLLIFARMERFLAAKFPHSFIKTAMLPLAKEKSPVYLSAEEVRN